VRSSASAELAADRPAAVKTYLDRYCNIDVLGGTRVTDQAWQNSFHVAIGVSAAAALGCARAWREDFRRDLARMNVPVLVVQGSADRVMPTAETGTPLAALLADVRLVAIPNGPHAITWTHADQVNQALLGFLGNQPATGHVKLLCDVSIHFPNVLSHDNPVTRRIASATRPRSAMRSRRGAGPERRRRVPPGAPAGAAGDRSSPRSP
jgi:hypothetical protein